MYISYKEKNLCIMTPTDNKEEKLIPVKLMAFLIAPYGYAVTFVSIYFYGRKNRFRKLCVMKTNRIHVIIITFPSSVEISTR